MAQLLEQLIFCSLADDGPGPAAVECSAKRIYRFVLQYFFQLDQAWRLPPPNKMP